MRYQTEAVGETTWLLGELPTGGAITITLYKLSDSSTPALDSNACTEISTTGIYKWATTNITTPETVKTEYLYAMTDGTLSYFGKIVVGGYVDKINANISTIHDGTAQAGTSTTITLAATASSDDGIYNRNLIVIVDGTGLGQTRTIADYDATTKVCVIDREWRVTPNNTSEYQILSDDTPLVMDHGIARGGTSTTITLRDYASSVNDVYTCNMVAIVGGIGRGQSRLVYSYDGTTKVVTICGKDWTTIPDTTSVYMLVPYGTTCTSCLDTHALDLITDAVWDEPKADHETSGTTGEYLTKIYNAAKKVFIRAGKP